MFRTFTTAAILTSAVLAAVPSTASADHRFDTRRDDHRDHRDDRRDDRHDDHRPTGRASIYVGRPPMIVAPPPACEERVWVPPVTRMVTSRVWVPATYATVVDRVWIEPVTRKVEARVWIENRFELRDVTRWENGCRVTRREQVLVEAGHFANVWQDEVIAPGRWEDRPRQQLVCEAHYESVTREEVVCAGHWETRPTRVVVAGPPRDQFHLDLRIPIGR